MSRQAPPARHALTRSPVFVLTLLVGTFLVAVGWGVATVLERSMLALALDLTDAVAAGPDWLDSTPTALVGLGALGGFMLVSGWLVFARQFRRLTLVYIGMLAAAGLSIGAAQLLHAVERPAITALFDDLAASAPRTLPTNPGVAALLAALVMVRQWIPERFRTAIYSVTAVWLVAGLAVGDAPPYLGVVLDIGLAMVGGSLVALGFGTPNLQPGREALIASLGACGIDIAELHPAKVDARGSVPWLGSTSEGGSVFVKALSNEQRAADLLFRLVRWFRLRRAGDAPPEASLQRAAEHEALVSHHARSIGIPTPRLLAVAAVGEKRVALAYEGTDGRSFDACDRDEITDDVMTQVWRHVRTLRAHGVAHRDLRLANLFLAADGEALLIDFGFAELAASQQLLDTDVAELLAASSVAIGIDRAVAVACSTIGVETIEGARDWLHPLALSSATRHALADDVGLDALRQRVDEVTGHTATEYEPLGRLSASRLIGLGLLALGFFLLFSLVIDDDVADRTRHLDWDLVLASLAVGCLVPVLRAAAFRAAAGRRTTLRSAIRADLASETPIASPTPWAFANHVHSDAARNDGLRTVTAKRAAATWTSAGIFSAPVVVAGFSAAALRISQGYLVGIGLGFLAGIGLFAAVALLLTVAPSGKELWRVWIFPYRSPIRGSTVWSASGWWIGAHLAGGLAFVLAARAAQIETEFEAIIAIWVVATTVAALLPSFGGLGALEVIAYVLLDAGTSHPAAALAVIVCRAATYWLHLPAAAVAYASTRRLSNSGPVGATTPISTKQRERLHSR